MSSADQRSGEATPRELASAIRLLIINRQTRFAREQETILWAAAMVLEEVPPSSPKEEEP